MSYGRIGFGATLSGSTTGSVGSIVTLDRDASLDVIDFSTMESIDAIREKMAGLIDEGSLTVTINYDGRNGQIAAALDTAFKSRTAQTWTTTYPEGDTDEGPGFISALGKAIPHDDKMVQTIVITYASGVTYAAAPA